MNRTNMPNLKITVKKMRPTNWQIATKQCDKPVMELGVGEERLVGIEKQEVQTPGGGEAFLGRKFLKKTERLSTLRPAR